MTSTVSPRIHPTVLRIQALLGKIDRLTLPAASRRDVESILVRQAGKEIDRALPWQAGHGRRTRHAPASEWGRATIPRYQGRAARSPLGADSRSPVY
jgi:hypothetical protein